MSTGSRGNYKMENRREFLKKTSLAGVALSMHSFTTYGNEYVQYDPICYFTKHLQWLDFEDLGIALNEAGFDGADLTVRPGGHIEPEDTATMLPKAARILQNHGISVPMVVTAITGAKEKGIDNLLKALADNGVKYYRTGYLNYDYSISMEENIQVFHNILEAIGEKNAKYSLCGTYQNHAGTRLGGSVWDLWLSLKGLDPKYIACQFDVRHATYEGGQSWKNDFQCIKDYVRTTVVKDFHWGKNDQGKWTNINTLMGEGMVDFETYFKLYHEFGIKGPISNHSEYPLITKEETSLPKVDKMKIAIGRLRKDVDFTRRYLK